MVKINKNINIELNPQKPICPATTDQGNKKVISKSNIIKSIATK